MWLACALFAPLPAHADDKVLRIISWADYVPADLIAEFRKQTG
ncbi:MAG: spermidine/putrescine ABC transporter substrate-binding protein PotF, partial [Gammaproteobacteria bacterium]|nr:spermidine/putrescine ABC transporter substrate-binding protein PotF [Gammaproteobacteria bacterium]